MYQVWDVGQDSCFCGILMAIWSGTIAHKSNLFLFNCLCISFKTQWPLCAFFPPGPSVLSYWSILYSLASGLDYGRFLYFCLFQNDIQMESYSIIKFVWLVSLRIKNVCEIHPICCVCQPFVCFYCSAVFHCMDVLETIHPIAVRF